MVDYNPKNWFKFIFAIHKGDTLQLLWKEMVSIAALSIFIAYCQIHFFPDAFHLQHLDKVYSLVGFVISLLLVFRTNTAYDRWYEGRKKWGEFVNDSRNLAVKLAGILKDSSDRVYFERMIPNFIIASKDHLNEGVEFQNLTLSREEIAFLKERKHLPSALAQMLYQQLLQLKSQGKITEMEMLMLDHNLNHFLDSLGACERIKKTPIPYSYSLFFKKFIFIFVSTIPLAFVYEFGYYSAIISTLIFYVLVSMEVLAEEIEDPFGNDVNDLPTERISAEIKNNVQEIFGKNS